MTARHPTSFLSAITLFTALALLSLATTPASAGSRKKKNKRPVKVRVSKVGPGTIRPAKTFRIKPKRSKTFVVNAEAGNKGAFFVKGKLRTSSQEDTPFFYRLRRIKRNTSVRAVFIPRTETFRGTIALGLNGLGESINVTTTQISQFSGLAESNLGVTMVRWQNLTTGRKGTVHDATGDLSKWTADIPLRVGDNKLKFTASDYAGSQSLNTTVVYHPALDFSGKLTSSVEQLQQGTGSHSVIFTQAINDPDSKTVRLFRSTQSGSAVKGTFILMKDDGVLPDEIESDGVFTAEVSIPTTKSGVSYYRSNIREGKIAYNSEIKRLWVAPEVNNEVVTKSVGIGNNAKDSYEQAKIAGNSDEDAALSALYAIRATGNVGASGISNDNGIWWISNDGILGMYHPILENQKAGGAAPSGNSPTRPSPPTTSPRSPVATHHYASDEIPGNNSTSNTDAQSNLPQALASASADEENRIESSKAIIISPYIEHPDYEAWAPMVITNNFGQRDDFYAIWNWLGTNGNTCQLYAHTSVVNNGSQLVNLETFRNLSDFGYIHISTHGDNYFKGLRSLWQDVWGPDFNLWAAPSQVVVASGIVLEEDPGLFGGWILTDEVKADANAKRIAIGPGGIVFLLPSFFSHHLDRLPNSLVTISACRSMFNSSLADAFVKKGAGAVLGYTQYVQTGYAQDTTQTTMERLFQDDTIQEAFDFAVTTHGSDDSNYRTQGTPAAFRREGDDDLKLADGTIRNEGFEDGSLSPWSKAGDGRVIGQLGSFQPTEGELMAIISTGLGFTTESGEISQDICIPDTATELTFDWNYLSEEFLEFCGSTFQDQFAVRLESLDENGTVTGSTTVFSRVVDDLCESVTEVSNSFDQGDVYATGWQAQSISLVPFQGDDVRLVFAASDVGDSVFDTAILLDNIQIVIPETP